MTHDDIHAGSKLRNNDPRAQGQIITVEDVLLRLNEQSNEVEKYVRYRTDKRACRIRFDRIFTDGKSRSRGYNLLPVS